MYLRNLILALGALVYLSTSCAQSSLSYLQKENLGKTLNGDAKNWFSLTLTSVSDNSFFNHNFSLQARLSSSDSESYQISLPQAYLSINGEYGELAIGRKFVNWSAGDDEWGLANVNAHEGISYIDFKKEGLFGLHFATHRQGFNIKVIASFFHLPQVNPGLIHKDGKITAKSEWTRLPPSHVLIEGVKVPLYFDVNMPKMNQLLIKQTLGLNTSYKWHFGELAFYGMYKPESNVRVMADSLYEQTGTEQVRVTVSPFVNLGWVYGTRLDQTYKNLHFISGIDVVAPDRTNAGSTFEVGGTRFAPKYVKRTFFHAATIYTHAFFKARLSYLKLIKGEGGADDYFSNDTMWHDALGLRLKYLLTDRLSYQGSLRFDMAKGDKLLTSEVAYRFTHSLDGAIGVELVDANNPTSYWFPYRTNDTVYSSLTYIF